ncbi:hypothetical protein, partial [Leisingera sp. ANG59]|uniref:hypothetical protein n=1 Tax=Leisingera sp. ANG59 TaxID=2675221 RepID=UPI001C2DD26E
PVVAFHARRMARPAHPRLEEGQAAAAAFAPMVTAGAASGQAAAAAFAPMVTAGAASAVGFPE